MIIRLTLGVSCLCSRCHFFPPLDLSGAGPNDSQKDQPIFSSAMHAYHGELVDNSNNPVFAPGAPVEDTCYQCHPGNITQCQRGATKTGGMDCNACHGTDLLGTPLAKMPVARTFRIENDETVNFAKNELVGCNRCHGMPDN